MPRPPCEKAPDLLVVCIDVAILAALFMAARIGWDILSDAWSRWQMVLR